MSQTALGAALGVSFQQVQKYEMGKDRVTASTLQGIAAVLGVHPGSFYGDDMPVPVGGLPDVKSALRIAKRIQRIRDPGVVKRLEPLPFNLGRMHRSQPQQDSCGTRRA